MRQFSIVAQRETPRGSPSITGQTGLRILRADCSPQLLQRSGDPPFKTPPSLVPRRPLTSFPQTV